MLLNIQSARSKVEELLVLLEDNTFPDIVLITEYRLKPEELLYLNI